jgi:hypothetical protein
MADELERIWKEVVAAWKSFYYGICPKQLGKLTKASPRTQVLSINLDHLRNIFCCTDISTDDLEVEEFRCERCGSLEDYYED